MERAPCSAPSPKRKLFLFCSHPLAQEQFTRLLKHEEFDTIVTRELRSPGAELETADVPGASLAIVDASNVDATLELVRMLRIQQRAVNLLVLMTSFDDSVTFPLLRLGVKGLLTYPQVPKELSRAARHVSAGGYWVPRELLTRFVESILPELQDCKSLGTEAGISRREREVLDLLLDNLSNKEIANKLFVSERTVKFHVSNLLGKFGVQRRADLLVLWMQRSSLPRLPRALGYGPSAHVN